MNWGKYSPALGGMSAVLVVLFHLDRNLNQTNEEDISKTIKILICLKRCIFWDFIESICFHGNFIMQI